MDLNDATNWLMILYEQIEAAPERLWQVLFALLGGGTAWFFRGKFDEQRSMEQHSFDIVSRSVEIATEQYRKIIEMQAATIKELERRVELLENRLNAKN
jgi:hypothetical protein